MKLLIIALTIALIPVAVFAGQDSDMFVVAVALFGEDAGKVIGCITLVGYTWAQVRQIIPAEVMAKLPKWAIWILEFAAANKYQSENSLYNDPRHHKSVKRNLRGR